MLILTEKKSIYRSDNGGREWEKIENYLQTGAGSSGKDLGKVSYLKKSHIDPSLIFFLGDSGVNWLSEDCGLSFKPINNGRKIHEFVFHPTKRNSALASIYTNCDDFENAKDCKIYKEIYYTEDLGNHWNFLADNVIQFDWGKVDVFDYYTHTDMILLVKDKTNSNSPGKHSHKNQIVTSDDFFKTEKILLNGGN